MLCILQKLPCGQGSSLFVSASYQQPELGLCYLPWLHVRDRALGSVDALCCLQEPDRIQSKQLGADTLFSGKQS